MAFTVQQLNEYTNIFPEIADWFKDAACKGSGVNFYVSRITGEQALTNHYCVSCPVRYACMMESLLTGEYDGCWGCPGVFRRALINLAEIKYGKAIPAKAYPMELVEVLRILVQDYIDGKIEMTRLTDDSYEATYTLKTQAA